MLAENVELNDETSELQATSLQHETKDYQRAPNTAAETEGALSKEEIESIREAGEQSPPSSSLHNQILLVGSFAVLGAYLRIVLIDATPSGYVNYLTSQFIGSFVIGLLFQLKLWIQSDLFVGATVGFCGSLTTFSTWQVDVAETLVGVPGAPDSAAGKSYVWFQDQLIGFAVPFCGLTFGKHIADSTIVVGFSEQLLKWQAKGKQDQDRQILFVTLICLLFASATLVGIVIGAVFSPGITTFSLLFAPFGAWLRFGLSKWLNALSLQFFWGTFAANVGGSALGGVIFDIMLALQLEQLDCAVLWAIQYGFCGSLTTISTFVNELHTLPLTRHAYLYGFGSILITQALLIIVMGSFVWRDPEQAFSDPAVCFFSK